MGKIIQMPDRRGRRDSDRRQARKQTRPAATQAKNVVEVEKRVEYRRHIDYSIVVFLMMLLAFGLVMVYSSSYYVSEVNGESQAYYFLKQLMCVGFGAVALFFFAKFDYHNFLAFDYDEKRLDIQRYRRNPITKRPYWYILAASIVMLGLVWSPLGVEINGSRRWINLGISIQPSEVAKIGVIIFLACSLGLEPKRAKSFRGYGWYIAMLGFMGGIILTHPNMSAVVCILALTFCMLIIAGLPGKHVALFFAGAAVLFVIMLIIAPYRVQRLLGAYFPDKADQASRWQLQQSLYSIGAGGLLGRGLGNSMQKLLYLPFRESDFIFAIIAEELGLVGCTLLITLFALLIWRGVVTAMNAPDLTGMLIAGGCTAALAIQVCVNIMVTIGLLPTTGVVLPFISYGGSAIVVFMAMVGMILNVSKQSTAPIPDKKRSIPFVVAAPKGNDDRKRGLDARKRRQEQYMIEQKKRNRRSRRR